MRNFASSSRINNIISAAISSANAKMRLKSVRSQLSNMVACNQFNTARAVEAFSAAIHWAVWDHVKDHPNGRTLYRNFKRSRLAPGMAEDLAAQFKQEVGAHDQRRPRRFLRFVLGP
jgi:hypothetical protein